MSDLTIKFRQHFVLFLSVAQDPMTAMAYAEDSKRVILALVLKGNQGTDFWLGANNQIFVLKDSSQIVPRYVVHFRVLN